MIPIFFAYSATAYLFSGSVCYCASFNHAETDSEFPQLKRHSSKLASLWIAFLWPLWIVKETKAEDNQPETIVNTMKQREYSNCGRELTSVGSRERR